MAPSSSPKRGALLTPDGRQKLEAAIQGYYHGQNVRVNSQQIAQQAALPLDVTIGILYGQRLALKRELKQFFQAFEVTLQRSDFQIIKPEREPQFATDETAADLSCIGREDLLAQLSAALSSDVWGVVLSGRSGVGKTTVGQGLLNYPSIKEEFPLTIAVDLSQMWAGFATVARQVLGDAITKSELATGGMTALIEAVVVKLQSQPILLWLQNLDAELAQSETFAAFFQTLLASESLRSRLLVTTTNALLPNHPRLHPLKLEGLAFEAIAQLYEHWGIELLAEQQQTCLQLIHKTYQGHPLALKLIAGEIRSFPYFGNIQAYWQDYGYEYEITPEAESGESLARPVQRDLAGWLRTLGDRTLQRLATHAPLALDLLHLGATNARPAPAYGWYFLIGEFSPQQQATTLKTLQERLLVETITTAQGIQYGVHPVLRRIITEAQPVTA